jgi:hypothetical protein
MMEFKGVVVMLDKLLAEISVKMSAVIRRRHALLSFSHMTAHRGHHGSTRHIETHDVAKRSGSRSNLR